ncbi:MAG: RNA polymerase sigma factor [Ignavibacteria bacterium]|nr:RNA polymerase sigma factor [Ignavibacteria bacterium]MBK9228253.1 RNA polymerase sigma factor [Ignavibacteria bacterium]
MEYSKRISENIKNGDTAGFSDIVREFSGKAFALTLRILGNKEDAEDSLQEAFMRLYRAIVSGQFEERSKLSTYFYTIVYNTAVDHYKKIKAKRFSIISIDVEGDNYEEGDDLNKSYSESHHSTGSSYSDKATRENEVSKIIGSYITSLPEQYSVILTMFYINDLSHEEISNILKLPIGTVKNRIFRAKSKLREIILKKYSEEEILQYV